jgi:hypothetical protein
MPQKAEYKVVTGWPAKVEELIAPLAAQGFRPILITSIPDAKGLFMAVVLEHVLGIRTEHRRQ